MVVDFHGTGFGQESDHVEESWATPDLVSASDDLGFIVVRPRSRSIPSDGGNLYQWDINPGDVEKNKAFATALVADLETHYNVNKARVYATGFSNGPSMAAQFLGDEPSIMHGYGLISGGLNAPLTRKAKFGEGAPRVYTMTGFRDYMQSAKDTLDAFLSSHAYPTEARFNREADTGHEVYGWHFREAFAWMDKGDRPKDGTLAAGYARETGANESLVEVTADPNGVLVAVGAAGGVYQRGNAGWIQLASLPSMAPLTDICIKPDGHGFIAGNGQLAIDTGTGFAKAGTVPEFGTNQFGFTYATSIGCNASRVTLGGVWSAATSTDDGKTWAAADLQKTFVSAIRTSGNDFLATGYWNYAGRSSDGATFTQGDIAGEVQWWNDVASSGARAIAVGEGGAISTSTGSNWTSLNSPTKEDLYAITFKNHRGVAVGAHGSVIVSTDDGVTWTARPTNLDGFLGGVRFVNDDTFVVVGERGTILRASF